MACRGVMLAGGASSSMGVNHELQSKRPISVGLGLAHAVRASWSSRSKLCPSTLPYWSREPTQRAHRGEWIMLWAEPLEVHTQSG